jgi:hypothetical protein
MNSNGIREAAIAHMAESDEFQAALRVHLQEIVEGEAFKGSSRCGRFLTYIVDQAMAGHFDSLKERVIGLELFERSPEYDTSEDAIVRVTASDVRKRLLQHYGKYGGVSEFRIALPLGSYVPEITRTRSRQAELADTHKGFHVLAGAGTAATAALNSTLSPALPHAPGEATPAVSSAAEPSAAATPIPAVEITPQKKRMWLVWLAVAATVALVNFGVWAAIWKQAPRNETVAALPLPWSVLFASPRPTHLITSDPDIGAIQLLRRSRISISDYANHKYLPDRTQLPDEVKRITENFMTGDKAATIDVQIAANIAAVANSASKSIEVQGARSFQFPSLKTDDNFIFLGSPMSNPWSSIFADQLDFRIVQSHDPGGETIENVHPQAGEQVSYAPTAGGGASGESFAIVAFIANPDQDGQVMLLAGANREGTQAAGKLVTDLPRLAAALKKCGLPPSNSPRHFELLLRVKMMVGYPDEFEVAACHLLPGGPSR